ncbi:ATP-dependent zinc metalloprotease FtsH [Desulfosarcina alkanivorans]|uniref:ATP-dependent zinc metalloprotease FtsH n=1 Tax=Desulfosarcina alkanivorans TaxID=571177 RepID=A0A5K7YVA7_9BACT|nr:ATP-dependent zinc metalloprotease FtsH [Desulfosarcina alkanivorans]BBO71943.1 ATP-dependent zinc metalloprotease FtsH [Desulfosarcina alkanivorans]
MKKQHRFSIWYAIIGMWAVLLLHNLIASTLAVKNIPYSDFVKAVKEGKVSEIAISENEIQGRMLISKDGAESNTLFRTVRVDPEISQLMDENDVKYSGRRETHFWGTLFSWLIPVGIFFGIWVLMMRRFRQQAGFMTVGKSKAKIYVDDDVSVRFDDAAGVDEAKQELEEIINFLKEPQRYTRLGGQIPRGTLLVGPPGTGKTLLAKAVAGESGVPFFSLSGSEFVEMFVGLGAARVRDLFKQAKEKAPCIIFIDELDALGKARGVGMAGGHDEREQTLNQLLVELDGFDANVGVILMAATNRPEILDPALMRPGRFDRQVLVDRPDKTGRVDILRIYLEKIETGTDIDPEKIAAMTAGMVGADLANLVNEAALLAVRRDRACVGMAEVEEAVERVVAGLEKKNRLINPAEKEIVAYHELGHALVAMALPGTDPVRKISIIPRGIAALGYTMQVPTEDRFLMRKTELNNRIATLLGGRAAEALIFNDISTGAQDDLSRATGIARSMVKEYGMSERMGQVYFAHNQQPNFLGGMGDAGGQYSDETAKTIDEEVRRIVDEQYDVAFHILTANRALLVETVGRLLADEVIEGDALTRLAGAVTPAAIPEDRPGPEATQAEKAA